MTMARMYREVRLRADMVPRGTTLWNLLAQVLQAQAVK